MAFVATLVISLSALARIDLPVALPAATTEEQLSPADWSSITDMMYAAQPGARGHVSFVNHAHDLSASIAATGATIGAEGQTVTLRVADLGRGVVAVGHTPGASRTTMNGTRAAVAHEIGGVSVEEWWVNKPDGLEQGFTVAQRPAGNSPLRLDLALGGSLAPTLSGPNSVAFVGSSLRYEGLRAWDATGADVPVFFELEGRTLSIVADDASSTYPLTIDPTFVSQAAYFVGSNTESADGFADEIAISGDTVVIGAPLEDSNATGVNGNQGNNSAPDSGAAYVFTRVGSTWVQQAYLKASNTDSADVFGVAVAISGDTIVVGAASEDSAATGVNGSQLDNSAPDAGAVYVFVRSGTTWSQQAYLKASNTTAADAFGISLAIDGNTLVAGAQYEDSAANVVNGNQGDNAAVDAGAAYVFTRSGSTWSQQAYLKASNTGAGDWFGWTVAIDGNTAVVGAHHEDSNATGVGGSQTDNSFSEAGAAYVFTRSGSTWSQQAYLKASNTGTGDEFGGSVDVDGDTVVVGAVGEASSAAGVGGNQSDNSKTFAGAAYVFTRAGSTWSQQAYLKASNTAGGDGFGSDVAVDADTVVVGAPYEGGLFGVGVNGDQTNPEGCCYTAGAAYVFARIGAVWSQLAYLKSPTWDTDNLFGTTVAIDGSFVAVGAAGENPDAAYAFRTTSLFPDSTYAKASNTEASDQFGYSIAVDGDTVVVGALYEDSDATGVGGNQASNAATDAGAVYVFTRTGSSWAQQAYVKASNTGQFDYFGFSVAIAGDTIVVGAPQEDSNATGVGGNQGNNDASQAGAAYVFTRSGTTWSQQAYLKASNTGNGDRFGYSVDIAADTIVVSAALEDSNATGVGGNQADNSAGDSGAAYVFTRTGTTWSQQAYVKASNTGGSDQFGTSVAIAGDTVVVGAVYEDSNATGIGGNQADNSEADSGAAYVFTRSGSTWSQQAYVKASNTDPTDVFGYAVAADANTIIVGAHGEDSQAQAVNADPIYQTDNVALGSGAAYVFARSGSTWSQQAYLKSFNTGPSGGGDQFGYAVALAGDLAVVGGHFEDSSSIGVNGNQGSNGSPEAGAAYAFRRTGTTWEPFLYLKASNTQTTDEFGFAVAIDRDMIVSGAAFEQSIAIGINGNQADNSADNAGAAYIFHMIGCVGAPFVDVAVSHPFCPEIRWMVDEEISTGFMDGTYKPAQNVTRQAMSAFMARLADANLTNCASAPFTDVPTSHPFCREIQWMKDEGISTGFGDGTYRPSINVTRQAMSAFMARLAGQLTLPACTVAPFSDVSTGHPFCKEIKWMRDAGISTGFSDGTYKPSIDVTRQAMSAFLYRVAEFVE